ncbi:MAG: Rieske 2Fe-2S domain-containing protein [SAR202 cluster bacterium]|nr:Rieske 2Fe-2S domain-containing protein [SAR202 cluster bacterium]
MASEPGAFDVCSLEELRQWGSKAFAFNHPRFGEHEIAVFLYGAEVHAIENACPHTFWPLEGTTPSNGTVRCQGHGALFDLRTGKCLDHYTTDTTAYRAEVRDGRVHVIAPGETRV